MRIEDISIKQIAEIGYQQCLADLVHVLDNADDKYAAVCDFVNDNYNGDDTQLSSDAQMNPQMLEDFWNEK